MTTAEVRKKFLDFFKNKDHVIFPSDSLIPFDKSVLFTSAGMNQFKPYFLGEKTDIKKATSCQKCLRTDDLDKVGKTAYHHTFFEMLGNFSFGDYFKKEAISFAWEFLTTELNIKEKDLWVSVYKDDDEAYSIWKDYIKVPEEKISKLGPDKNFWPANALQDGPNGPCGPCSEIFFDQGETIGCGKPSCSPACDCSRFVEVWNLVFTQFNRVGPNKLEPLPQKNIDTGMGLERIASVLQGKQSNFQIDIFFPIVERIWQIVGLEKKNQNSTQLVNAVADHIRAATFLIADGVYPSNEERGYVLRKIIRRAVSNINLLGYNKPCFYMLSNLVIKYMKDAYPEIEEKKDAILRIIQAEEEKFLDLLDQAHYYISTKQKLNAEELFYLYDTKGFPLEIIIDLAKKYNISLSLEGFDQLLIKQRELSKKKSMFDENIFAKSYFNFDTKTIFIGYDNFQSTVNIVHLLVDDIEKDFLNEKERGVIVLDKTPFYPESGGQLSDKGYIETKEGKFFVEEVKKIGDIILHSGFVEKGKIKKDEALAFLDVERRKALSRAHTATHLLQAALRKVLGETIMQQGSLVDVDRLHFDFTHPKALASAQLEEIQDLVNEFVLRADPVEKKIVSFEEAKKEKALAFFKDKYEKIVRLVSISDYSKELCGGSHLDNTSQVGLFIIISEFSISSGIRRIEALVGKEAYNYINKLSQQSKKVANFLKCNIDDISLAIEKIFLDLKNQKEHILSLEKELLAYIVNESLQAKKQIQEINFITVKLENKDYPLLFYFTDLIKQKLSNFFVFIISNFYDKQIFVCRASNDLVEKNIDCLRFLEQFKDRLSLKGGGRKELVQGIVLERKRNILFEVEECFKQFLNL
ncbi:MAG: alanine--tRNA ligase [Candidatus Omnitrophica bacterium]|nr:alanine--tRNA ligase [Candidatus Omnitrophota bacterium]